MALGQLTSRRPLTARAQKFLDGLEREQPTPVAVVQQLFEDAGLVPEQCWLDFHHDYAGYVEGGAEVAIWGLASEVSGRYRPPRTLWFEEWSPTSRVREGQPEPCMVDCADLSAPDFYQLDRSGAFVGHPSTSESFEIKVERSAINAIFYGPGTRPVYEVDGRRIASIIPELEEEMADYFVPEASDRYGRYYLSPTRLLIVPRKGVALSER